MLCYTKRLVCDQYMELQKVQAILTTAEGLQLKLISMLAYLTAYTDVHMSWAVVSTKAPGIAEASSIHTVIACMLDQSTNLVILACDRALPYSPSETDSLL